MLPEKGSPKKGFVKILNWGTKCGSRRWTENHFEGLPADLWVSNSLRTHFCTCNFLWSYSLTLSNSSTRFSKRSSCSSFSPSRLALEEISLNHWGNHIIIRYLLIIYRSVTLNFENTLDRRQHIGEWPSLRIIKLGPTEAQEWVMSVTKKNIKRII